MERLQKVLAQAGLASRRAAEQIILAGRVRVDGKIVTELGTQVDPRRSRVEVDGNKIVAEKLVYIVLHKPRGVVCTLSDPEGRPTIHELLKGAGARVVPVGRLDFHTSGALLCTNDGEFAQALAHPKREVPKVYVAKVKGTVDDDALPKFSERIVIDGRETRPAQVRRLRFEADKTWLEITLREGRNRQVRRLGEATGFPVMRLARISHAGVTSEDLRPGQWRPLTVDELVDLKKNYGVPKKVRAAQLEPLTAKVRAQQRPARPDVRGEAYKPVRETRGRARSEEPAMSGLGERRPPRGGYEEARGAEGRRRAPRDESQPLGRGQPRGARSEGRGAATSLGRSEARGGRGEAKSFGRGESKPFARGEAKPFARGEAKSFGRGEAKSFGRGEAKSFGRGEAKPFGRGEAKPFGRGEAKPFARGESKPFARGESKPFARGESKPFARGESKPFARGESKPFARGEGKPLARGESKPFGRGEAKPFGRGEERGEAKSFGRGDARGGSKAPARGGSKAFGAREDRGPSRAEAKRPETKRFAPKDAKPTAKRDARGSAPRRGTSR